MKAMYKQSLLNQINEWIVKYKDNNDNANIVDLIVFFFMVIIF